MKIRTDLNEFFDFAVLYLLERLEERRKSTDEESSEYLKLSEDREKILDLLQSRNVLGELKRYKLASPILSRNKYNFVKKVFKGQSVSDSLVDIKGEIKDE
jgi:hypothetical protein